jgi:lipopolysaccharide export LptBFGC system permease protein LptF
MADSRNRALAEFKRMIAWIALAGVIMVAAALFYISRYEPLRLHMVIATVLGVFFSVLLGAGLFAAAFFSDKSGHDASVRDATTRQDDE